MIKFLYPTIDNAKELFNLVSTYKDEINEYLPRIYNIKTIEDERLFLLNMYRKGDYGYGIYDNEDLVGYVGLYNVCYDSDGKQYGELGVWTTKKGTGYNAVNELINKHKSIDKFVAIININNVKSISMIERLGFKKKEKINKYRLCNGKYENVYIYIKE